MTDPIDTIAVRQVDGGTRYLALSPEDYRRVLSDRTLLDAVAPLGVVDRDRRGWLAFGPTGPRWCDVPPQVRAALYARARGLGEVTS